MPCYHPIAAYQTADGGVHFSKLSRNGDYVRDLTLPCGQCVGCRLERSRQWAMRCLHEKMVTEQSCFLTLTYSPEHLPADWSLDHSHIQKFFKRYRKLVGKRISYYMAGEYGEENGRPHYHLCVFGHDFDDKKHWRMSPTGFPLYRSPTLEKLWPFGNAEIGAVTFETAAYTARYIMKKVTGDLAPEHYKFIVPDTGEVVTRVPEYNEMSRNPSIGKRFYEKFLSDIYPHGYVIVNGRKVKPPRYYGKLFDKIDHLSYDDIKTHEEYEAYLRRDDNTPQRLEVKETVTLARVSQLKRSI